MPEVQDNRPGRWFRTRRLATTVWVLAGVLVAGSMAPTAALAAPGVAGAAPGPAPADAAGADWPDAAGTVVRSLAGHPNPSPRLVALTFDDGPYPSRTTAVLDTLERYDVPATFFVLGANAQRYPSLIRRMDADGHTVAAHTMTHASLRGRSYASQWSEIDRSADVIDQILGAGTARCFRPPYGSYDATTQAAARARGLSVIMWSRDAGDTRSPRSVGSVTANTVTRAYDGGRGIALLHDTNTVTVDALPGIISRLKAEGYQFVSICGEPAPPVVAPGVPLPAAPLDVDSDGQNDLFFYGEGRDPDGLWLGHSRDSFSRRSVSVSGSYEPLVGDFDGDGADDVFWYRPGAGSDGVWFGSGDGSFSRRSVSVSGSYEPLVGDFDGDGADDVFWYRDAVGSDGVWFGAAAGRFARRSFDAVEGAVTAMGDFDGDGRDDVFFYRPGRASDPLWFGQSARTFARRDQHVTGDYQILGTGG